jgi:ribosomal protein S18 acetylase RimI-like enzyme
MFKMIKPIVKSDLITCLEVIHFGYETVAVEFKLTEENCPDRGRASLPLERLVSEFENGSLMFGYFLRKVMIGFLSLKIIENGVCKLNDIIILPEYRNKGYGKELLDFSETKAIELGANKVTLGMIDDNQPLKNWYIKNGFVNIGLRKIDQAPFTVGYMECSLPSL